MNQSGFVSRTWGSAGHYGSCVSSTVQKDACQRSGQGLATEGAGRGLVGEGLLRGGDDTVEWRLQGVLTRGRACSPGAGRAQPGLSRSTAPCRPGERSPAPVTSNPTQGGSAAIEGSHDTGRRRGGPLSLFLLFHTGYAPYVRVRGREKFLKALSRSERQIWNSKPLGLNDQVVGKSRGYGGSKIIRVITIKINDLQNSG